LVILHRNLLDRSLGRLHAKVVFGRRARVLSRHLARLLPTGAEVLDVGCGNGRIGRLIMERRRDVSVRGLEVRLRPHTAIPVTAFDGTRIPLPGGSMDAVLLVDVLHHARQPDTLLAEALRVARRSVLIKDHTRDGALAPTLLTVMDWMGNAPHGVALYRGYRSRRQWLETFRRLGVRPSVWLDRLDLYPPAAAWLFERQLHFIARIDRPARMPGSGTPDR
jgi:SAM-dependent methyltransferase